MENIKPCEYQCQYSPCVYQPDSFYSVRQDMVKYQYRLQYCCRQACRLNWEGEQTLSIKSPVVSGMEEPDEVCADSRELKSGDMEKEVEAEKIVPEYCISFAESALRVASSSGKSEIQKLMRIIFGPEFETGELGRYAKTLENCERIVIETSELALGKEGFFRRDYYTHA